ncbi:PaaI family thioesterase [Mycolicibacterium sp. 018/SC-01/001]|uniref:PaaI family thioesterase n=1 Tax=Mycolicibacterium sp. 018/SC-01/001 TaxID=2592069 RepID=UPI00117F9841|nr:PaaI family thioesterase [Mycolicibacterium sp. 018/SC-01/001]TRW88237.1 PaaI family thioesterase [Mycolicibacterium sp. 018/SC-01/001]
MDFTFDLISADDYEGQRRRFDPLTDALRELIDLGIHTDVDDSTVLLALEHLEAAHALLEQRVRTGRSTLRHAETGRAVVWGNPAVGLRNAIAPPMEIERDADGVCRSEFTLGPVYEGPPGLVHGGICALVLDHLLGEVASDGLSLPKFTGTISLRYRRGTPLGPVRAEGFVERTEGHKTFARGYLKDADGVTVEADGVFIVPAWARDAG